MREEEEEEEEGGTSGFDGALRTGRSQEEEEGREAPRKSMARVAVVRKVDGRRERRRVAFGVGRKNRRGS